VSQTPSLEYTYRAVDGAPVAVATKTLNNDGTQQTSYELYDGWLRSRQTQTPSPDGRLISDTFYGVQGEPERTFAAYPASGAPDTALSGVNQQGAVESQTRYSYDGLGRVTLERLLSGNGDGTELWHTTTAYGGDRVTVTPPSGGIPTTTISDARGRTVELRQLKPGGYTSTSYTYEPGGQLASTIGPDGKQWTYDHDLRGRRISSADPDKGTTTYGYDDLDRPTSSTDARGTTVVTTYDPAGRKTGLYEGSATGTQLAGWVYDTARKGQPTSATSYAGGQAYTATYSLYDNLNRPQRTTYSVPSSEGALAGNYLFATGYNLDGTTRSMSYASGGGLGAETVVTSYDDWRRPAKLDGNLGTYVTKTTYDPVGKPLQYQLSSGGKSAWLTYGYEYGTQRLHESRTDRENIAGVDRDAIYHYNDAGNVTSVTDTSRAGTDQQCFRYDDLNRLTDAWAQNGGTCATDPSSAVVGGPAGYRASYSYDAAGNRVGEAEYGSSGATLDARVYGYAGDPGVASGITGHQLGAVTQTGANAHAESYTYDEAGNTTSRTVGGDTQTLDWDVEGRLSTVSSDGGDTSYVYDTDGNRLLRRDPSGTTLYLPGTELRLDNASGAVSGTRYYTHGGGVIAMRTTAGVRFLASDPHGTAELQIDGSNQALTQRRFDPFGRPRGNPAGVWTGEKGFVGGTRDPDGLTHLGARDYDPDTGRFISVDPVFDLSDPQSWNGYTYADNNPATLSDPMGLCSSDACSEYNRKHHRKDNGDAAAHAGPNKYYAPSYPVRIPSEYLSASPKARRTLIRLNIVEPLKNSHPDLYRQAMAAFCSEYSDDPSCGPQAGADTVMDLLGMIPVIGSVVDVLHGASYAARGNYGEGAAYLGFLVPEVGDVGQGVKITHDLRSLGKACRRINSFIAGTLVLTADGTAKAIEKVKVGDKVVATDPKTGKTRPEPVVASFGGADYKNLVKVTVDTDGKRGHRTGVIIATEHHLFWDQTHHAWTRADRLSAGVRLRTNAVGKTVGIVSVAHAPGHPIVHDLTVVGLHTYYVDLGITPVLVHNSDPCLPGVGDVPTKVANSNMPHAAERAAERLGFEDVASARTALQGLGRSIEKNGFPEGTIPDTNPGRVLVPFGDNGYVVYQIAKNGNAVLKTVLNAR
jgi:RHS repeat-associated protein